MNEQQLRLTRQDHARLCKYLSDRAPGVPGDGEKLNAFAQELCGRALVDQRQVPPDVVTMHSRVRLRDVATKEDLVVTLVFPEDADLSLGKLSVLTEVGTALLGRSAGDIIEWQSRRRLRRLLIKELCYQPEAAGDYSL